MDHTQCQGRLIRSLHAAGHKLLVFSEAVGRLTNESAASAYNILNHLKEFARKQS